MATIFAGIVAIAAAVPVIDKWLQSFVAFYAASQLSRMKKENIDAIREAFYEHDQRGIEKAFGNPNAGEPSGVGIIVDSIPGVSDKKTS